MLLSFLKTWFNRIKRERPSVGVPTVRGFNWGTVSTELGESRTDRLGLSFYKRRDRTERRSTSGIMAIMPTEVWEYVIIYPVPFVSIFIRSKQEDAEIFFLFHAWKQFFENFSVTWSKPVVGWTIQGYFLINMPLLTISESEAWVLYCKDYSAPLCQDRHSSSLTMLSAYR